jgi:hypothetical protein
VIADELAECRTQEEDRGGFSRRLHYSQYLRELLQVFSYCEVAVIVAAALLVVNRSKLFDSD